MRTIQKSLIGLMTCICFGYIACSSPRKATKNEASQQVQTMIDNKQYTINITRMNPMSGPSKQLTSSYSLTIKGDTVVSHLPYFGQAYTVPYGGGVGLTFEAPITVYTLSYDRKGQATISFQTRSEDDVYRFNLQIFDNGSSSVQVTPNNRQAISYYGELNIPKEK